MSQLIKENEHGQKLVCESFEYRTLGKLRFIGYAMDKFQTGEGWDKHWAHKDEFMPKLDELAKEYGAQITEECAMMHHNGKEVGVENHYLAGRLFKEGTPVPDGYDYYDIPTEEAAYAICTSNHYDGDLGLAYVLTRDKILSDKINIPYPHAYWHAAVYTDGRPANWHDDDGSPRDKDCRFGYLFSCGGASEKAG